MVFAVEPKDETFCINTKDIPQLDKKPQPALSDFREKSITLLSEGQACIIVSDSLANMKYWSVATKVSLL